MITHVDKQFKTKMKEPTGYVRWLIIQGTDKDKPINKLFLFLIDKALKSAAGGELKTVKCLQKGDILLEASLSAQSIVLVTSQPWRGVRYCSPFTEL